MKWRISAGSFNYWLFTAVAFGRLQDLALHCGMSGRGTSDDCSGVDEVRKRPARFSHVNPPGPVPKPPQHQKYLSLSSSNTSPLQD
ncbi:hypothetical protein B0J12DRAFT_669470 [Macrophomina phaseolina]|uniref:Uncharacterized protein n=1 Tax=Macrophomina phaseolina TaxID=35725 RepID=A0ABQ8G6B8_9PEZI|nr:hypothetical protein B0J12DRAFT_669470 [Macrophomina phaseolina]